NRGQLRRRGAVDRLQPELPARRPGGDGQRHHQDRVHRGRQARAAHRQAGPRRHPRLPLPSDAVPPQLLSERVRMRRGLLSFWLHGVHAAVVGSEGGHALAARGLGIRSGVHLVRLALTDFRCYPSADVTLSPGVTTFTGPNGAGKTNLIEAAYYVATFGSHRVATDAALVRSGAGRAILRAAIRSAARDSLVEIELNPGRPNRVRLNRAPLTRPREALGTLRCVLFAPEDLSIVKGDPAERRRYLDDLLVASR